jgi:hypothetical protein
MRLRRVSAFSTVGHWEEGNHYEPETVHRIKTTLDFVRDLFSCYDLFDRTRSGGNAESRRSRERFTKNYPLD